MNTRNRHEQHRSQTPAGRNRRIQIEMAACEVIAQVGYASASISRIASHAKVSKGVVSYHFSSRDEIMRQISARILHDAHTHFTTAIHNEADPLRQLHRAVVSDIEYFSSRRVEFLALNEIMGNRRDDDFNRVYDSVATSDLEVISQILNDGQRQGLFRSFDTTEVACYIVASSMSILERWIADEAVNLEGAAAALLDFTSHAVVKVLADQPP